VAEIDEFGPLELEGKAWRKSADSLLENKNCLLLTVRNELVEAVKKLYGGVPCQVFPVAEQSVKNVISLLEEQGEKIG
jgi:nucleoside-triphosphatase THEP1